MNGSESSTLSAEERRLRLEAILSKKAKPVAGTAGKASPVQQGGTVRESAHKIPKLPGVVQLSLQKSLAEKSGISNPFFPLHEGVARDTCRIGGREFLNFSTYNYLDLCGHPEVNAAAVEAVARYGTSASASRLVSGDRPVLRELEQALAGFLGVEDCVVFVGGHATNVTVIGHLFGPRDLILHDSLAHNCIVLGAQLSKAHRVVFPHNRWDEADRYLSEHRYEFEKVLIAIEGVYSMDGDTTPLADFVRIKETHKAMLLVDEAHSLGVLGEAGRGISEHCGVNPQDVEFWMGTLSKTLAAAGGYIAGCRELAEYLKFTCPGFVYSVGLSPVLAAASLKALEILRREPWRGEKLRSNGAYFLQKARSLGLDTGLSEGYSIVPIQIGSSVKAALLSNALNREGINVQPIIHPAVEERAARLRFFLSCAHSVEQYDQALEITARELAAVNARFEK